jgi:hypothetical protein
MIVAEPSWSSQELICPSMVLALESMKIFTFIGLGIFTCSFAQPIPLPTKAGPLHSRPSQAQPAKSLQSDKIVVREMQRNSGLKVFET